MSLDTVHNCEMLAACYLCVLFNSFLTSTKHGYIKYQNVQLPTADWQSVYPITCNRNQQRKIKN